MTRATFKKAQLDHLIDVILEAGNDHDHACRHLADQYPVDNVQDYINISQDELDTMELTKSGSNDPVTLSNAMKKRILSLKGFWWNWEDNTTKDWTVLDIDQFEEYLMTDSGPQAPSATPTTASGNAFDVTAITNAVSTAMLAKPPTSCSDLFMQNKGGADDIKPLKEPKQWNTWQQTLLSVAHAYDFKDITDASFVPDTLDADRYNLFTLQQKHAFGILVSSVKESSALPVVHKYSDPNAHDYGDAQIIL